MKLHVISPTQEILSKDLSLEDKILTKSFLYISSMLMAFLFNLFGHMLCGKLQGITNGLSAITPSLHILFILMMPLRKGASKKFPSYCQI